MTYIAVGMAGIIGALLRYYEGLWVHGWGLGPFPLGTLFINWTGCFGLAWFTVTAGRSARVPAWLRVGIGTGLIGSYTTFSTFSVETVQLLEAGQLWMAAAYVIMSLVGGLLLAAAGQRTAERRSGGTA